MKKFSNSGGFAIAGAILGGAAMIAMNQDVDFDELLSVARSDVTAVEIIKWGEDHQGVAKFDTRTGEIRRFSGDVRKGSTSEQWIHEVDGVGARPIGTLRLQHANTGGLFMVDAVSGETWILRERASDNYDWVEVVDYSTVLTTGNR
jgi:hypothetical protein